MTDIPPELIEKAADAIAPRRHDYRVNTDTWRPYCACGWSGEELHDVAAYDRHLAELTVEAVADDLRAEGATQALREAADALDREDAEEAAKVRMGNVRCLVCKLEWNQRSYFGCHGDYHEFDGADVSRAGEVRIEETYAGQFLRALAAKLREAS